MASPFVEIETEVEFKESIGIEKLPDVLGPARKEKGSLLSERKNPLQIIWTEGEDNVFFSQIQSSTSQASIRHLLDHFDHYSRYLVKRLDKLGAKTIRARLKYYPDGENGSVENVDKIRWIRLSYWEKFRKYFMSEAYQKAFPAIAVMILVYILYGDDKWFERAKYGVFVAAVSLLFNGLLVPFLNFGRGLDRE